MKKIKQFLPLLLLLASNLIFAQTFVPFESNPLGTSSDNISWGDFDNDGYLDVLVSRNDITVYRNNGNGTFTIQATIELMGIYWYQAEWFDYNNNGKLDILARGDFNNRNIVKIFENTGNGTFSELKDFEISEFLDCRVKIGDYLNDGLQDLMAYGYVSGGDLKTLIFQNNGNGTFSRVEINVNIESGIDRMVWADFFNNGYPDIMRIGYYSSNLYKNNGNGTFQQYDDIGIDTSNDFNVAIGDYDNDGYLDLIIAGEQAGERSTRVYRNNGNGTFSLQSDIDIINVRYGDVAWGDCNGNGYLDIAVSGQSESGSISNIYINNGNGTFTENTQVELVGVQNGSITWADYNNNGKLDLLISGYLDSWDDITMIYTNTSATTNSPPNVISNLQTTVDGNNVTLSWDPATDNNQDGGHSYSIYVYDTQADLPEHYLLSNIPDGKRIVAQRGDIQTTSYTLNLPPGSYQWSVQAIDASLQGGEFAAPQLFTISGSKIMPRSFQVVEAQEEGNPIEVIEVPAATSREWEFATDPVGPFQSFDPPQSEKKYTPQFTYAGHYYIRCRSIIGGIEQVSNTVEIIVPPFSELTSASLPGFQSGNISLADYTGNGSLDYLLYGYDSNIRIYENNGNGNYSSNIWLNLQSIYSLYHDFADFNNSGHIDLFVCGDIYLEGKVARLYRNNGNKSFSELPDTGIPYISNGNAAWGDYNNNGHLDLFISGVINPGELSGKLFMNNGDNTFTDQTDLDFHGFTFGSADWGDYNNNGFLDLLISGNCAEEGRITVLYRNNGDGTFTEQTDVNLPGVFFGSVKWGDYNNNGYLDILISGRKSYTMGDYITTVFRNNGDGTFTEQTEFTLPNVGRGSAAWGDYNADGYLDILITGEYGDKAIPFTRLFRNNGEGAFSEVKGLWLPNLKNSSIAWGDINGNGKLDIALTGQLESGAHTTKVFLNTTQHPNTPPNVITNLQSNVNGEEITFTWDPATDDNQIGGHSYNLYIRNPLYEEYLCYPEAFTSGAEPDGQRMVARRGSIQTTSFTLNHSLPSGRYLWSVQAIDASFAGGEFAVEQEFFIDGVWIEPLESQIVKASQDGNTITAMEYPAASGREWKFATSPDGPFQSFVPSQTGTTYTPLFETPGKYYIRCESTINGDEYVSNSVVVDITSFAALSDFDLPDVSSGSVAWGDYDKDGHLDILITGETDDGLISRIYRNNGDNTFSQTDIQLPGVRFSCVAWADYNSNGHLDILITGDTGQGYISMIYKNNADGTFTPTDIDIPGIRYGDAAWGDLNNNGLLDLVITGERAGNNRYAGIFINNGDGSFTELNAGLTPVRYSSVALGDYDNSGFLDILITGESSSGRVSVLFANNGDTTFTEIETSLPGVLWGNALWGDYDNDGYLDILIAGLSNSGVRISQVFRNNGDGSFTHQESINLPGVSYRTVSWVDFNSDGYLDILINGSQGTNRIARLFSNNTDGTFTERHNDLPAISHGSMAWADFNSNGKLDLLITGRTDTSQHITNLYINIGDVPNEPPDELTNLQATENITNVTFSWDPAVDPNQSGGHSYNLYLYNETDNKYITYMHSALPNQDDNGKRLTASSGAIQGVRDGGQISYTLNSVLEGCTKYRWSVQAIDAGFIGGPFSTELTFETDGTIDQEPPVPNLSILPLIETKCSITITSFPTATDKCEGEIVATTTDSLEYTQQGEYTITWTYDDGNGNITSQLQTVIVADTIPPVPDLDTLTTLVGLCSVVVDVIPTATDGCAGQVLGITSDSLEYYEQGEYTITWTYDDGNGNITSQLQKVIVADTIPPAPDLDTLPTIVGLCSVLVDVIPTATDGCAGQVLGTTSDSLEYNEQGEYTITWTYDDGNGNTSTQLQTVIVADTIAPVPDNVSLPDLVGECSVTVTDIPTATDNCADTIVATTTDSLLYNTTGEYTITWIFDDDNGNITSQIQNVIVIDTIPPAPDLDTLATIVGLCSVVVDVIPMATDGCTGPILGTTSDSLEYYEQGEYTITWTYDDGNGNITTQLQTVIVSDTITPVPDIISLPDLVGVCSVAITDIPTATDICAGTIVATTNDSLLFNTQGEHTITWTYDDGNGNITTQNQTVIVVDTIAPIPDMVSLPNLIGDCSVTVDGIPTATDNCNGTILGTTTDPLEYTNLGEYVITWEYNDGNGNITTQNQTISVIDTIAPVPSLLTLPSIEGAYPLTITSIPTAIDNCIGLVDGTTSDPLEFTEPGENTIEWIYDDGNGNVTTQTQIVSVITLEVNKVENDRITVYPNPTSGIININLGQIKADKVVITDITGRVLLYETDFVQYESIDISTHGNGIYILSVYTSNYSYMIKVIKH